jgi:hypothetical protein
MLLTGGLLFTYFSTQAISRGKDLFLIFQKTATEELSDYKNRA